MPVKLLTVDQHRDVLKNLVKLGKQRALRIPLHPSGEEYTSLMICFLMHSLSAAESVLSFSTSFGNQWFPATVGYTIVRPMFEIDVTAHYISQAPVERARQYIDFGAVLTKRRMDAYAKHRNSKNGGWKEGIELEWQNNWAARESEVKKKFEVVSSRFTRKTNPRKGELFDNWSGKSIRKMAEEVNHLEAYDVFYSELSSFTHGDVHLADRFLQRKTDGPVWSQRANEFDVGNVLRHGATFLTCLMELFGQQFKLWSDTDVETCWDKFDPPTGKIGEMVK